MPLSKDVDIMFNSPLRKEKVQSGNSTIVNIDRGGYKDQLGSLNKIAIKAVSAIRCIQSAGCI